MVRQNGVKALLVRKSAKSGQNRGTIYTGYMFLSKTQGRSCQGYKTEISMMNGYEGAKEVIDYAELSIKESQIKWLKHLQSSVLHRSLKLSIS